MMILFQHWNGLMGDPDHMTPVDLVGIRVV